MNSARNFPSVCELADDPGFIGQALRALPDRDWLLPEADRWQEPWKFLLGVRDLPKLFHRLFKAGQSQRTALGRIAEITRGAGSIERSWGHKMKQAMKSGDAKARIHAENKVFDSFWRYNRGQRLLASAKQHSREMETDVCRRAEALYEKACRKLGRTKADEESRPAVFNPDTVTKKIAWELACGWLRNKSGAPGYCFYGDSALRDILEILLRIQELPFYTVRKTRQFIGLMKAPTFIYKLKSTPNGTFDLLDRRGEAIWNIVRPAQRRR